MFFIFLFPVLGFGQQRWNLTIFGGFANYYGDLNDKAFTLDRSHPAFGVGLKYHITPNVAIRSSFTYGRVEGTDQNNKPSLKVRNLSFKSTILEGNLLAEYTFLDLSEKKMSPYLFTGLAVYHFDPYAFDTLGNKVHLKPLSTEGQGLPDYPNRKPYNLTQISIPMGGGVKFRVTDNSYLAFEFGFRKLFTDYLDDVSTTYVDQFRLAQARGPLAVEMAYRGDEIKEGNPDYPPDGEVRGGSEFKDWYYFSGFTLSIGINNGDRSIFGGRKRGGIGCPKPVY
jgi:hypothetical protein